MLRRPSALCVLHSSLVLDFLPLIQVPVAPSLEPKVLFWARISMSSSNFGLLLGKCVVESGIFPFKEMESVLFDWLYVGGNKPEIPEETLQLRQEFAKRMLTDLTEGTRGHPGIQHQLKEYVEALDLDIDLATDPVFEALYPGQDSRGRRGRTPDRFRGKRLGNRGSLICRNRRYAGQDSGRGMPGRH